MKKLALLTLIPATMATSASAVSVVSMYGDQDNFGLTAPGPNVPDGTRWRDDLGGVFFTNYQTGGDPVHTDKWDSTNDPSFVHTYSLPGAAISASLELHLAGVADDRGPYDVLFNNTVVGQIPTYVDADNFQKTRTLTFGINTALLTGSDTVLLQISGPNNNGDGYSFDYSKLTVEAVPEPGTMAAIGLGLAAMARKRRK